MPVVQNLYQIFKLPASFLVKNGCNIKKYDISQGLKDGNIVSIGDNLVFQQLRYLHGDTRDHRELFNYTQKIRNSIHEQKKLGNFKEASILEKYIVKTLFVEDIVNIVIDGKKSDFHKFRTKGFYLNGKHYLYLCSGSGQIRRNTATFASEEYHGKLIKILNCGLDEKTQQFVLAKYSAYFALAFSSILWVRTPRVCVIKDFYNTLKQEPVDFVFRDKNDNDKFKVEERLMDLELNCADGQGIIDPYFAQLWAQDMDLSYIPCSFVARSCFIKGNLVTFDFKEYALQHGITTIRDKWGKEYDISEIDVLLSESQFKTSKYYSSWQDYCSYTTKNNIHWGVARYTKKEDDEYTPANYQYIQSLTLDDSDIKELIAPTAEWIKKICTGDLSYALLYTLGGKSDIVNYKKLYDSAQTTSVKAIVKNSEFLNDSFVRQKIYKNITETINHAKLGKIWVHGNYQFMIADPMAQCQSALGLPPTGLLKAGQIYSQFWRDRFEKDPQKSESDYIVDACRSPMIDLHEHNPMNVVVNNEDADYWYKYIYSGIIYNVYDSSCFRHSDSDYDGDIVMTTDNKQFIKGSNKDHNIITYEKGLATPENMTIPNITATVMKGFGTGVGGFSNTATILYAMSALFNRPGREDQYNEIMTRIKLLRQIVGQEIDRIKGADKPQLPTEWRKIEKIISTDSQEEITRKIKSNAMVISKKPYFFRYLYPDLNQKYKQFEASYNQVSKDMFGIKFKKLLRKENQTEEEKNLIRMYQKKSPLIIAPCTMNRVCKEFESIDFDIVFAKSPSGEKMTQVSMLPTFEERYADSFDKTRCEAVKKMYQLFSTKTQLKYLDNLLKFPTGIPDIDDYQEIRTMIYDDIIDQIQHQIEDLKMPGDEFLYYCYQLSKSYANFNWAFAWQALDEQILWFIQDGDTYCPVKDSGGEYEYLGNTYSLVKIPHEEASPDQDGDGDGGAPELKHLKKDGTETVWVCTPAQNDSSKTADGRYETLYTMEVKRDRKPPIEQLDNTEYNSIISGYLKKEWSVTAADEDRTGNNK